LSAPSRWGLWSSLGAPLSLVGGFCWGAARQRAPFDSSVDTISALAAVGADERWIMSTALVLLGACHVLTALALSAARVPGRLVLAAGGLAILVVAAYPLPSQGGSREHFIAAMVAFLCLAVWPLFALRRAVDAPRVLSVAVSVAASGVLLALLGWLVVAMFFAGRVGLAERVVAVGEALWPLVVVLGTRGSRFQGARG
jgi:hypothetical membrane protein